MPVPSNSAELLALVRRSGVIDDDRLTAYVEPLSASGALPGEPSKLAGLLVRDGLITLFQAEQLLQGKWKRFCIGKYRILERLGSGGMGQVFLCEHKLMRRRVAIKVLPAARAEEPAALERFYREARAAAALDHPNLVRAFDIDRDQALHFLVMEYVDGISYQDYVKKLGPMDSLRACHYIRQAAAGLDYAFQVAGLIHRDIKPGNVLIDRAGVVKILDMGLARFFNDRADVLTRKYDENVLGTADYLAPEQALDSHSVDIRADIYSLGATFYFVLTGRPPFPDGSLAQKLIWHQSREPKRVRELRPEVPEAVAAVAERMMRKAAADRYQTPAAVIDALAPFTAVPIPPPAEREMPVLSLAAMAGSGPASISARMSRAAIGRAALASARPGSGSIPMVAAAAVTAEAPSSAGTSDPSGLATNPFRSLLDPGTAQSEATARDLLKSVYSPTGQPKPSELGEPSERIRQPWFYAVSATLFAAAAGWWFWLHPPG